MIRWFLNLFRKEHKLPEDIRPMVSQSEPVVDPPPGIVVAEEPIPVEFSRAFIEYMKVVEGSDTLMGHHFPYHSMEGGNKTVGYGHKLTNDERDYNTFADGLTEEEAEALLVSDLRKARSIAASVIGESWDTLSRSRQEMATDFAFNLGEAGFRKFKTFRRALIKNDLALLRRSYRRNYVSRSGDFLPLVHRNRKFYETFLI